MRASHENHRRELADIFNRILKSALARAVEQQALTRHPADALKRSPKVERRPPATLSVEQSQRLLAGIKHTTTYWPVMLALATGLRRGEIFALRWRNVDLNTGTIRVVESLEQTKAGLRFKSTKSEKGRGVALPSFAIAELRRHKRDRVTRRRGSACLRNHVVASAPCPRRHAACARDHKHAAKLYDA